MATKIALSVIAERVPSRIYSESQSQTTAANLAEKIISDIKELIHQSA